jgi:Rab-like protein 2
MKLHCLDANFDSFGVVIVVDTIDGACCADFWDTAGQERFEKMHPSYYHQAHACLLVFDVTRKATYKNLGKWYKELREYRENIPCICVANKIDMNMEATQKAFRFASKNNMPFYFVSAADGTNVVTVFEELVAVGNKYKNSTEDFEDLVMELLAEDHND